MNPPAVVRGSVLAYYYALDDDLMERLQAAPVLFGPAKGPAEEQK